MPEEKKKPNNYPGNSHKSRVTVEKTVVSAEVPETEEKRPKPVIKGSVVKREKTLGQKIKETFTGDDAKSLTEYLLIDVAIPALKSLVVEATEQGIQRLMFGDVRPRSSGSRVGGSFTNYNRMSSPSVSRRREEPRSMSRSGRATHNFDEIVLDNLQDAQEVIDNLQNIFDEFGVVTVRDLYDLVNYTAEWTDEKWGWESLANLRYRRIPQGFLIDIPKPSYLE